MIRVPEALSQTAQKKFESRISKKGHKLIQRDGNTGNTGNTGNMGNTEI